MFYWGVHCFSSLIMKLFGQGTYAQRAATAMCMRVCVLAWIVTGARLCVPADRGTEQTSLTLRVSINGRSRVELRGAGERWRFAACKTCLL